MASHICCCSASLQLLPHNRVGRKVAPVFPDVLDFRTQGSGSCRGIGRPLPSGLFTVVRGGSAVLSSVFSDHEGGLGRRGGPAAAARASRAARKSLRIGLGFDGILLRQKTGSVEVVLAIEGNRRLERGESNFDELHAAVTVLTETSDVDALDDAAH